MRKWDLKLKMILITFKVSNFKNICTSFTGSWWKNKIPKMNIKKPLQTYTSLQNHIFYCSLKQHLS